MTGDDDRIVDAVLGLLGFCDPPPTEGELTSETRNRLLKTSAWDLAADALEADPILGPILNKRVSTSLWDTQLVLEAEVLYDLVIAGARASDPGSGVRQALGLLRDQYRTTSVPVVSLAPITGIVVGTPILLDENVELRQLSDSEVDDLFLADSYPSLSLGLGHDIVHHGLVVTTHVTRVVTDPGKSEPRRSIDSRDRRRQSSATPDETVLTALRLHVDNPHAISFPGSMTFGPGQSRSSSLLAYPIASAHHNM
jgi:hypothetical protein